MSRNSYDHIYIYDHAQMRVNLYKERTGVVKDAHTLPRVLGN